MNISTQRSGGMFDHLNYTKVKARPLHETSLQKYQREHDREAKLEEQAKFSSQMKEAVNAGNQPYTRMMLMNAGMATELMTTHQDQFEDMKQERARMAQEAQTQISREAQAAQEAQAQAVSEAKASKENQTSEASATKVSGEDDADFAGNEEITRKADDRTNASSSKSTSANAPQTKAYTATGAPVTSSGGGASGGSEASSGQARQIDVHV